MPVEVGVSVGDAVRVGVDDGGVIVPVGVGVLVIAGVSVRVGVLVHSRGGVAVMVT